MAPGEPRVVDLRIPERWILPLRVRRLAAELRVSRDALGRQAARDARVARQTGKAEPVLSARRSKPWRILAALRVRPAESHFEQRPLAHRHRRAGNELLIARVNVAVAAAARWQRERRLIDRVQFAPAVACEERFVRAWLQIDLAFGFVRMIRQQLRDRI